MDKKRASTRASTRGSFTLTKPVHKPGAGDRRISPALLNKLKKFNLHQKENIDIISDLNVWTASDLAKLPLDRLVHSGMKVVHARKIKAIVLGGDVDMTEASVIEGESRHHTPNGSRLHSSHQLDHDEIVRRSQAHIDAKRNSVRRAKGVSSNDVRENKSAVDLAERSKSLDNTAGTGRGPRVSTNSIPGSSSSNQSWTEKARSIQEEGTEASAPSVTTPTTPHSTDDPNWWTPLEEDRALEPVDEVKEELDHWTDPQLDEDDLEEKPQVSPIRNNKFLGGDAALSERSSQVNMNQRQGQPPQMNRTRLSAQPPSARYRSMPPPVTQQTHMRANANPQMNGYYQPAQQPYYQQQHPMMQPMMQPQQPYYQQPPMMQPMIQQPYYPQQPQPILQPEYDERFSSRGSVARGSAARGSVTTSSGGSFSIGPTGGAGGRVGVNPQGTEGLGAPMQQPMPPNSSPYGNRGSFNPRREMQDEQHRAELVSVGRLVAMGKALKSKGLLDESLTAFQKATGLLDQLVGREHPDSALCLYHQAHVLRRIGKLEGAKNLYKEALGIQSRTLGDTTTACANTVNDLAIVLQGLGDLNAALAAFLEALRIKEAIRGSKHPDFAMALNNVATMLQTLNRLEEALVYYERSLKIKEACLGPEHQSVADTLFNIGAVKKRLGDVEGASECFLRSAGVSSRSLGPNHAYTKSAIEQLNSLKAESR